MHIKQIYKNWYMATYTTKQGQIAIGTGNTQAKAIADCVKDLRKILSLKTTI